MQHHGGKAGQWHQAHQDTDHHGPAVVVARVALHACEAASILLVSPLPACGLVREAGLIGSGEAEANQSRKRLWMRWAARRRTPCRPDGDRFWFKRHRRWRSAHRCRGRTQCGAAKVPAPSYSAISWLPSGRKFVVPANGPVAIFCLRRPSGVRWVRLDAASY